MTIKTTKDYLPLAQRLLDFFVDDIQVESNPPLKDILASEPKLIGVYNHGPALSPLVYCFSMIKSFCDNGGENRSTIAIFHKYLYQMPFLNKAIKNLSQLQHAVSFNEFIDIFTTQPFNDVCIMPEGDNCMCGDGVEIQPFRSPRFVEMSIRSGAPMLLCVQLWAEQWAKTVKISPGMMSLLGVLPLGFLPLLRKTKLLSLPRYPDRIPTLYVRYALYKPTLTVEDLHEDRASRNVQLCEEAEKVRTIMQNMVSEMTSQRIADGTVEACA